MNLLKLVSVFTILIATVSIGFSNITHAQENKNQNSSVLTQQRKNHQDVNINVMSSSEINNVNNSENQISDITSFRKKIMNQGFKEMKLENQNSNLKYSKKTEDGIIDGYISNKAYKNTKTNEIIVTETLYDTYYNEVSQFVAEKRSINSNSNNGKLLLNYKSQNIVKADDTKDHQITTYSKKKFKFNGKSFACSLGGLYACGQFCGVWAAVHPIAGGTCGAVCGGAFAAACSSV